MRIGISTTPRGRLASGAATCAAAVAAEQVGYSSLWVIEPSRSTALGPCGEGLDPVALLGAAAGATSRIRLGATLPAGCPGSYPPGLLRRSITTLDQLSDGRFSVGLSGHGLEPVFDQLAGVGRSRVLVTSTEGADLDLVARRAHGWVPTGVPLGVLAEMWERVGELAAGLGRDPGGLELVVRAQVTLTDRPLDGERPLYTGDVDQVAADVAATARTGAAEVVLALAGDPTLDEALDGYARVAEAVGGLERDAMALRRSPYARRDPVRAL